MSLTTTMSPLLDCSDLLRIFTSLDRNRDGKLTLDELEWLLHQINAQPTRDDLELLLIGEGLDFDGFVCFYESTVMVKSGGGEEEDRGTSSGSTEVEEEEEKLLLEAFKVFDLNGDGFISADEIGDVLRRFGMWRDDGGMDCALIVRAYDVNSDGFVDFEEFKQMMLAVH